MDKSVDEQVELIKRGSLEIVQEDELRKKIEKAKKEKRPLRVKMGADPTAPDIHLGHSICLRKLRDFQDLGHEVFFLVGDFTARIGDPSGKSKTRPRMSEDEIKSNAETYKAQVFKILDPKKTTIVFNSDWCGRMTATELIQLASQMNVARMLEREDFKMRYSSGQSIAIHEFLYPLIQGFDSVALKADIEIGGQDQRFNLLVGRDIQRFYEQEQQVLVFLPLLEGTDGKEKMSKSLGNAIGIEEKPQIIYEKLMGIPDALLERYFEFLTRIPEKEWKELIASSAREAHHRLAHEIVSFYHSKNAAETARQEYEKRASGDASSVDAKPLHFKTEWDEFPLNKALAAAGALPSSSEARRLLQQGACTLYSPPKFKPVKLNLESKTQSLVNGSKLKLGKKIWLEVKREA